MKQREEQEGSSLNEDGVRPLAVVVPTYNRCKLLLRCVESLLSHTPEDTEIIISDDGSTDDTARVMAEVSLREPRVRYLLGPNAGPAVARNRGWRAANASVIAFVDDDCIVEPNWGATIVAVLEEHAEWAGVEGKTSPEGRVEDFFFHSIDSLPGAFLSCNLALRVDSLRAVDGFDEGFPFPQCEDIDLCLRVTKAVGPIGFCGGMRVSHGVFPVDARFYLRRIRWEASHYRLFARHPEQLGSMAGKVTWIRPILVMNSPLSVATYCVLARLRAAHRLLTLGQTIRDRTLGTATMLGCLALGITQISKGAKEYRRTSPLPHTAP